MIELISIDSTNNYAMQLIDADKAQHGMTITALTQTGGKGQRSKMWVDTFGQSLLMSIIVEPRRAIQEQFAFNASVAAAVADMLKDIYKIWEINIKWPNDIIINDKKAGGILIENVIRGSKWSHSVIGIGLNVKQEKFPRSLPFATSLKVASGVDFGIKELRDELRAGIMRVIENPLSLEQSMEQYNEYLYRKKKKQKFNTAIGDLEATIVQVHTDGTLEVELPNGTQNFYHHGQVTWVWGA
jgi:BirA family transcriptional regulator, biotin operon repressor / biotin---[acetyl-CoA-carboxylase] ligase